MILKQGMKVLLKPKEWYDEKKVDFLPKLINDMEQYFGKEHIIKSAKMGTYQLGNMELFTIESDNRNWYFSMDMVDKYYDVPVATSGSYSGSLAMQQALDVMRTYSGRRSCLTSTTSDIFEQVSLREVRDGMRNNTLGGPGSYNGALGFSNSLSIHVGGFIKYVEKFVPFAYDGVVTYTDDENNSFTLTQLYERFNTNS